MSAVDMIRCDACGATNRVPKANLERGLTPMCGRCKAALVLNGRLITVTDATFAALVERSPLPVLLDLWAPWCGPCRLIAPVVESLAAQLAGQVRVGKLNVDENPVIAQRFAVRSIPTLLAFKDGREVDRMVGVLPQAQIAERLARLVA
jgi:thioredoxin 2